ncbi:MAG: hypothetical protein WCC64_18745 [Aliidongia sp.]
MPEAQAEVLADEQARRIDEKVSTKAETVIRFEIRQSELRLETKIETTKFDIVKWMFGTIMALARRSHP